MSHVRVHDEGGLRAVTLDRPEKRNALTVEMLDAITDAFDVPSGIRAVTMLANGRTFCAGFDLEACVREDDMIERLLRALASSVRAIRGCAVPVVAGVRGAAVAGGCALVSGADIVVAHPDTKLGYPVVKLGVSPAINVPYVAHKAGAARTRERTLDPGLVRASDLPGFVHELTEDPDARAREIAMSIGAKPPGAIRVTRDWLDECAPTNDVERALQASLALAGSEEERRLLHEVWNAR